MIQKLLLIWILVLGTFHFAEGGHEHPSLEDRFAISEMIAEYAYRWDRKDAIAFSELFAPNASMDWVIAGKVEERRVEGRDAIIAYAQFAFGERIGEKQSRHHFSNLIFKELSSNHAVTEHMVLVTHISEGQPPEMVNTGSYRIEWKQIDEEWLITRRTLFVDR